MPIAPQRCLRILEAEFATHNSTTYGTIPGLEQAYMHITHETLCCYVAMPIRQCGCECTKKYAQICHIS